MSSFSLARTSLGCWLFMAVAACSTPDVRPFAHATDMVGEGMFATAQVISAQTVAADLGDSEAALDLKTQSVQSWELRKESALAMHEFAHVLLDLANSGASGEETGQRLADSLGGLAHRAGIADNATIEDASGQLVPIFGLIAEVRATRGLRDSLRSSAPIVRGIHALWAADLDDALALTRSMRPLAMRELNRELGDWKARHDGQLAKLQEAYIAYAANEDPGDNLLVQQELASYQATLPGFEEYSQRVQALEHEFASAEMVVRTTQSALAAWADTLDSLVAESESAAEFNLSNVLAAVQRLQGIANQFSI